MRRVIAVAVCAAQAWLAPAASAQPAVVQTDFDVVVYGGSSAGVTAAVQAARMGKSVVLISPDQHIGGMTASGLGTTDTGNAATIGGLAYAFYAAIAQYYDPTGAAAPSAGTTVKFDFEPHAAEAVFWRMMHDAGAACILGERLNRATGVHRSDGQITSITMRSGRTFSGRMFIDATYEGDLMAAAGVPYRVGRESSAEYGETLAGVQLDADLTGEVDPYQIPGRASSGLLPGIAAQSPGPNGTGDSRVQQYNLRLCITNATDNQIALGKPEGYDPRNYQLLARRLQQHRNWSLTDVCKVQPLPNQKADLNATGSFSTDMAGDESSRWPDASDEERAAIYWTFRTYTQGMFWFLGHDSTVSPKMRAEASRWGLAKDEFADSNHWPWQLYVREARRMSGAFLMTQQSCDGTAPVSDPVALGSYALDSHKVTLFVDDQGRLNTEGFFFSSVSPYGISYRSLIPEAKDCTNLLVPVCLSATHVAFNSLRMEPVFMMLGQSAATAACVALDQHATVQDVRYADLALRLQSDGQILTWKSGGTESDLRFQDEPDAPNAAPGRHTTIEP